MESSDSDVECGALFGQIRPYQLEPYAARRPEGEEVAAGVDVVGQFHGVGRTFQTLFQVYGMHCIVG